MPPARASKLAQRWSLKTDEELAEAAAILNQYTEETQRAVVAELARRHIVLDQELVPENEGQETFCYHCGETVSRGRMVCATCESCPCGSVIHPAEDKLARGWWRKKDEELADEDLAEAAAVLDQDKQKARQAVLSELARGHIVPDQELVPEGQEQETFCYHCGSDVSAESVVCTTCGKPLD
jgi:Zn finger protein HypA/HybF involved in hydrogenase expression